MSCPRCGYEMSYMPERTDTKTGEHFAAFWMCTRWSTGCPPVVLQGEEDGTDV